MLSNASATGTRRRPTISSRGCHGSGRTSARHRARTSTRPAWDPRTHTHTATEPKKPAGGHRGARLLADLAPQGVRPVLARLGPAAGQAPAVTIATDQHDSVPGDTDSGRAMPNAWWSVGRRVPRHPPVLTVAGDHPGNTVLSDAHAPRLRLQPTGHPPCPQTTAVAGSIQQGPVPESCQTAATHDLAPPDDTAVTTHLGGCGGM